MLIIENTMDLKFITTDNSGIYIVNDTLAYTNEASETSVLITGNDQPGKALRCSEFTSFLKGQSYLTGGIKYVNTIDIPQPGESIPGVYLYYRNPSKVDSDIPTIDITDSPGDEIIFYIDEDNQIKVSGQNYSKDLKVCDSWDNRRSLNYFKGIIEELYNKYIGLGDPSEEVYNQISSRYLGDYYTENYIKTYTLVSFFTRDYTNQLDLREYIHRSELPGISGKLDLSISYSLVSEEFSVYSVSFTAFSYTTEGILKNPVRIFGDQYIQVEYIDGILTIYPKTTEVTECIINNCILNYGKL